MEEFEENGNETTAKASNGLSYQGLSRLASGAPAPETPAAGDTPATPKRDAYLDFLDNLQAKQKYARGVELDRDLYEFYNSGDAKDEEKAFAFYDKWTQDRFGVGTTRGDIWTRDRKGFDNAQQYGNALFGLSQRGYAAIASPEYKAWEKACAAGDRAEMMRLAGIDPTVTEREGEAPAYTVGAAGAIVDNRPLVSRQKTDEEIDEELDAHNAKMKSENWLGAFRAMDAAYHFTDEEKELVRASLRSGDGLPKEYEDTYAGIIRGDVSRAAVLNYLIDNGRHVESRWLRDNVVLPFTSVVKSFWQGAKDTFEEASLSRAYTRANYETVRSSSDSAKFYWNDEERAEYKRLLDSGELAREAEARHYANADLAEIAKERVDAQCARRLADEAKPREQYLRERRERLYLEDALSPKAAGDYGWFSRSVSGAISTLPYMVMSATPAGFAWNVAAQFQDVRNDLILRGEDPDKALFFQAFSATAWAAIEKVQWGGLFGKELSNLAKKRLLGNVLQKAWGAGKLQGIGTLLKEGGKDVLKKTVKESLEEGMQGGLEGWTREYLRSADLSKAMDAAVGQAASDFVDSLGAMGLVSLASTGAKFSGARHAAVGIDDLVEVAQAKIHALNTYKNTLFDPEKGAPDAQLNKQTAAFAADCQSIMDAHVKDGSGAIAAMDEIAAKYALAPKESQAIAEWLDLRQNAIGMAKWANSDAAANFAARELGALPIGNDTTFDVEGLFRLVNPNARVERMQVADTAAPAPETVRHVNADEVDALEAQLAGMKARLDEMPQNAKKRKAERQYAERAKRLARLKNRLAEEEQTAHDAVPTKDVVRVTIPMGDKGETKSFVVETSSAAPDIESRGFAASVSEAMRGAIGEDGVVDGGTLTDEQFAALPIAQKANVAVTENQYLAMSEEDKAAYLEMNSLKEGGDFRILDGEGKVVYNADALVTLKRALNAPSPFTRVGGNSTLAHEYSHAISRFARDLGLVSGEDAKTMSALFGAPRKGVDELWDEEAVGDGFVDFLRGKYDFRRLTEEERRAAMGFFERIWDAIKSVFRLNGMSAPVTQHDRNRREQARETAFEAIQRGDFAGLSQYAGIKFDDDASAPEKKEPAKTEEKPQEAKAEEKKTSEETPPPQKEAKPEEMSEEKPARETDASVDADRLQEGLDKVSSSPREAEASTPRRVDLKRTIFTPDYSMKVETETLWAPLADLVESTDDRTVQMRDRSRVATDMQVLEKTRKGTFQPLALFPGTKSDDGAPIVGGGLRIVSGHGRKRMLETLAREGRYSEYLDAINEECRKQGIPSSPAGMKNPVLVSRITGGLKNHADLARFAERSNRWGGLERSGAEYAESDARAITPALMRLYAPDANGNLLAASNREFMGAFLDAVGATGLTNADGTPTPEAALRVRRALMTALFGDDERVRSMVRNLLEKGDELSTGTLLNALMKSAGRLLALKDGRASYDIVPDVREAALQYIAWRVEARRNPRLTLSDHLAQTDLFSASATPVQQALARLLENGRFGAAIDRYAELAAKQAVDAQTALPGFAPATPLQLLSRAERDTTPKNPDGSPVAPYVTPDPESEQAKTPVQTPPAVQEAPKPAPILEKKTENAAVEAAKAILAPKAKETPFVPVPFVRGTATLPQPGAPAIVNPKTGKPLKTGAYNLLRGAYETAERPTPSAQDKSGRGLGIFNPPKATDAKGRYWGDIFPHFQGNKTEMADRVSQALRVNMTRQERDHYKTVVDYFGGGGCWGLYNALTNFDNADRLVVNEYDPDRLAKIRLLHEVDGKVADIAESLLFREGNMERLVEDMRGSRKTPLTNSPNVLASHAESLFWEEVKDANDRAAFMAFLDCAHTMLSSSDQGKSDPASRTRAYYDIGVRKALDAVRADGKRAKEAADAFKARGGTIDYRAGDAANWPDAPHGDEVVAVFDPPYYRTMGYDGSSVPLDAAGRGWDYKTTAATLRRLVDAGDAIVYTDEAWWLTGGYSADEGAAEQLSLFDDIKPVFAEENDLLLGIINNFDHFDVAGAVDGRQETLGVQHGHKTDERTESGAGGDSAEPARTADGRGTGSHTGAVQPVDAGDAGQSRPTRAPGGSGGRAGGEPTAGERALARAVIADDIARHSVSRLYTGSAADYDQPSLRAVGTGVGRQAFGWGLYASKNRAVAENHATREQNRKSMPGEAGANAHVYEQTWFTDRPEGDESRLLEWDEVISAEILARIEKQSDAEGIGQEVRDALRFGNGYEGDNVYDDLRDQVFAGDAKATSEFLARAGIDGMKYPAAPRGWNYISFRDDNMRIDHHWVDGEQRYSVQRVTPEEDAAYMDAVRRGDTETAQRMVREAAKRAMPNTQVVGEDGLPRIVYHATDEDFTRFDRTKLGKATEANSGNVDMAKIGFWFNDNDLSGKVATNPAKTKAVFLDLENPARATFDELWDGARDENADGYIVEDTELGGMSYVALDPAQIKSAEPVTYDDAGRIIPLSERFDPADPDIRHSVRRDPWHSVQYGYAQAAGYSEDAHLSPEDKQATDYALDALIEKHHSGSERFGNDVMLANMYPPDWAERPVVKFALQFVGNDGALRDIRKAFFLRNGWRTNDKEGWLRYNAPAKAAVLEKDYSPKELQEKKNRFQTLLDAEREVAKKRSALQKKLGYPAYKDSEEWSRLSAEEQRLKAERLSPDKRHADAEADYQKTKAEWERSKDAKYEEWRNERVARGNAMLDEVAREHGKKTLGEFIAEGRTQPERHSVRRGRREDAVPALDIATGYLARRLLGGKTITPQQAKDILGNLGFVQENPAEVLRRAQSAADTVRERVKDAGERADSELYRYLSQASMTGRMQEAMDRAITGAAQAADPEIGRRLERAISSKRTRDLEAANGFTAAEMMAELPISLTDAFLSVAEFERTPEEKARLEAERANRAEEEKTDGKTDEELLAEVDDGEVTDPTPEQVAAFDELMGRARYAEDARKRKEAIDIAARAKAKAEAGEEAQSEDAGSGEDEDAIGGIPLARIRRIAPVFEDQNLFAAFLIEWTAQKIVQKHPELTNNRDLWKSPVAIRELKQTATHILRRLAADILGSPTGSHARNFADHIINELESDATCRTYKAVRRKIAYVYDAIHTDGLRQSRKELMHRLTDGWREKGPDGKYIVHPGIRQLVGAKGRFSATTEEGKRKIDGRTEMYGRTLLRVLAMSDEELQARDAELREITDINPTATGDAGAKATEEKVREAAAERAIIAAYGGLARRLPGEIRDATERILADLQGKRQAFEARREAEKAENDKVKAALVEAMSDTPAPRRTKPKGRAEKYIESFVGNIGLEMRNLIRYCKDGKKRDAAQDVITDTEAALSEATGKYRATKMGHEIAINAALKACYGNAADGVRHLTAEPVPEEVARAVFGQDAAMTPTYGNLLQLYASIVQADYKANAEKHGRLAQLPMIRAALTDADMRFYAFALGWYRDNRAALSDAVEAVTGVPVVSPDPLYVPVRVARPVEGLSADVVAWSPIPRALSLRVPHGWDFDEHANFFRLLDEQAEMHAQTVAYAKLGIRLRDTWASREVQDAARRNVGSDDMMAVTGHMRDVLAQDAARPEDTRILSAINYARAWIARFAISGNLSSAMSQPASIPVWANIMLGHEAVGFRRLARYMLHVDADAVRDLVQSDGYRARYLMGWTEDVQNAILHPSKSRIMSTVETAYDKGMALSKVADKGASLWIAQGFYRDARDMFIRRGDTDADAKRKAIALTWAAVEASQQTGRSEYLNRLQRGNGAVSKILFQFRTAQLLSNNYLIQAVRDVRAGGDPAAKGRLLRAVAINTIIVPAYLTLVRAAWDAILGDPPPETEDVEVPEQVREFLWNAIDNNTAPLFFVSAVASAGAKPLLGLDTYGASSGMPAVDSTIRIGQHAGRALADASRYIVNLCTADDIADEVTAEKLIADVLRLGRDIAAPVRHAARAYDNYMGD